MFSLNTRIKRSAQPLLSGSRTKSRRALDAQEFDLVLELMANILAAMVVTKRQAGSDRLGRGAEAIPVLRRMDADALCRAVIDCDEHRGLVFAGRRGRHICTPQFGRSVR